eukprot:460006-Alexandrium_andersonii.AAC.1
MVLRRATCKRQLGCLAPCEAPRWQAWPKSRACIVVRWMPQREPNNEADSVVGNSGTPSKRT